MKDLILTRNHLFAITVVALCAAFLNAEEAVNEKVPEEGTPTPIEIDYDGDMLPGDPLPFIANVPIYWYVNKIELSRSEAAAGSSAWSEVPRLEIASTVSFPDSMTSLTAPPRTSHRKGHSSKVHPFAELGIVGSDTIRWGALERFRVARFLKGCESSSPATPVDIIFTIRFVNLGTANRRFESLEVPVSLDGKIWATARPSDPQAAERGIIIPADGKSYSIEMSASIPVKSMAKFLNRLSTSPESPVFEFENASGLDLAETEVEYSLAAAFKEIREKCIEVSIADPCGRTWRWFIAKKTGKSSDSGTFGEWINGVNSCFQEVYGAPLISFYGTYPVSLVGFNSTTSDKWWKATYNGREVKLGEVGSLPMKKNIHFFLSNEKPRDIPPDVVASLVPSAQKKNPKESEADHLARLAEETRCGCSDSGLELVNLLIGKALPEGFDWLDFLANEGDPKAQCRLAAFLRDGELGTNPDAAGAAMWYKLAASAGDPDAMLAYGEALRAGRGVKKNLKEAVKYFKAAAEAGNSAGQTWYAISLLNGEGTRKNVDEAIQALTAASSAGNTKAMFILGVCRFRGLGGCEVNESEAFKCFEQAAKDNDSAKIFLGYCYMTGRGVVKDDAKAFANFNDVAEKGEAAGELWLAHCYANGIGVEKNVEIARKWAKKVADAGFSAGRSMLLSIQE